jgi:hypothetical protein
MVIASWTGGWRRVTQAPGMAAGVHVLSFVLALPLAMLVRDRIAAQLGSSLAAGAVADGVNNDWWSEFTAQAGGLSATFTPANNGFASTLDTLSRVLDARYPPPALMWLLGGYLALWTFLSGGILDRYARQRPILAHGFFGASGRLFFRLARLTAMAGLLYWLLFAYVHPWLFLDVLRDVTRGVEVERTVFLWRLLFYAVFGLALITINLVFDYARIRLVVEDRRSALGALRASIRFLSHHPLHATCLYALNGAVFVLLLALWSLMAPGVYSTGVMMWIAFAAGQLYLFARLALKLHFLASQTALFQAHLAHAGYTAAPVQAWPESPAAELIEGFSP